MGLLFCDGVGRSLKLSNKLLRLLVRRKATMGGALKTLAQREDEDKMFAKVLVNNIV